MLTPAGDLVQADTYNKLFTMHGMVMVFFFLIPSIPAVLGNFLVPMMIGAKDLAFPRINLLSWYLYIIGGVMMLHCMLTGGVDTGVELLRAVQHQLHQRKDRRRPDSQSSLPDSLPSSLA